jgi:hypothetical protein
MSKRSKVTMFRDQISEKRLAHLYIHQSAECALLFAFLDRYCATQHNCGLWKHSPDDMALSLGMDSGDEVRGMLFSLAPLGILFDPETNLVLNIEQMGQYHDYGKSNPNMRKGVEKHLSTLPDSDLKQRLCNCWGFAFESVEVLIDSSLKDAGVPTREREKKEPLAKGLPKGFPKGFDAPCDHPSDAPSEKEVAHD